VTGLHAVVPDGIDDLTRPSGGNVYDRRVVDGLRSLGHDVRLHPVPGAWPTPDATSYAALAHALREIEDGSAVLLDGLVASAARHVLVPESARLKLVVLVHTPLGAGACADLVRADEHAVLAAAVAVIATSDWSRRALVELYGLPGSRVHVARPGVDAAELAAGTEDGGALLCVAAVIPGKGHDVLLDALAVTTDLRWRCHCVGTLERDPSFAATLRRRVADGGMTGRIEFTGAVPQAAIERTYAAADALVLPSRGETYGMVVTEALAHGLPVIASDVGGIPEALGQAADGTPPGLLVPPEDPAALGTALRAWLTDGALRRRLRRAARDRRSTLSPWSATTSAIARVLAGAAG
jgi:glycosyltransferase involved in cell wall biosynthesis